MIARYLETGEFVGTHGVRGELRLYPWSDSPASVTGFSKLYLDAEGKQVLTVQSARVHGNLVLLKVKGIDDIPGAEALRGKTVYCDRRDIALEHGRYFVQDLLGCTVTDADSDAVYGRITDVMKTGANDVWEITDADGKATLIPAIPDVLVSVEPEKERVTIRPLKGLFDDDD